MHVRPARPGDAEALRAAVSRARETAVFDDFGVPLLDASAAGVREAAAAADCGFLVESDNRPIGLALAHPDADGEVAELLALWVHPQFANDGVERTLLHSIARSLKRNGVTAVRATIPSDEPATREFYRSIGFNHKENRASSHGDEEVLIAPIERLQRGE